MAIHGHGLASEFALPPDLLGQQPERHTHVKVRARWCTEPADLGTHSVLVGSTADTKAPL
jgi:hypothetical protein